MNRLLVGLIACTLIGVVLAILVVQNFSEYDVVNQARNARNVVNQQGWEPVIGATHALDRHTDRASRRSMGPLP
jgi:hypothetical protein